MKIKKKKPLRKVASNRSNARGVSVAKKKAPKKTKKRISKKIISGIPKSSRKQSPFESTVSRFSDNPIIAPNQENGWEAWQTFNPGAVLLNDRVHFLYRAIGDDGISRLGYAVSDDGFTIDERHPYPVCQHKRVDKFNYYSFASGGSFGGLEDPRIVRVDDEDMLRLTYTSCEDWNLRMALTSIKIDDFLNKKWNWTPPISISPPGEVHKNWVIFPEKINGRYAILHSINPKISIEYLDDLNFDNISHINSCYSSAIKKRGWDGWIRGAGPPPIKTKYGWLLLYHAMDKNDFSKYKVGAMILDLENPEKILYRSAFPILEPCEDYENNGAKSGVVYVSGLVIKDGALLIYYGGADSYVCVASANLDEFLSILVAGGKPKLKSTKLKKPRIKGKKC